MAKTLCRVAGGGKPLKGNAEAGDVLAGKTFSNKQSNALTGTMPNNGAWSSSTSGAGTVTIPAGYHNGSGGVDCSGAYNAGVAAADARVNTSSASYNSGYTNGKNDGYNSGLASGSGGSDVTISFPHPGHYLLALRGNTYVFYPGGGGSMGISASGLSINQVTSMAAPNNGGQINVYHVNVTSSSGSVSFTRTGNTSVSWWYV